MLNIYISSSSNHLLHVNSLLFGEMWHFVTIGRTSTERDGNSYKGGGSKRKRVPCPSRPLVLFCGAEAVLLTGSYGSIEPRRRPWMPTHLEKRQTADVSEPPPPSPFTIFRDGLAMCSSSRTDSRFLLVSVRHTKKPRHRLLPLICLSLIQVEDK